VDISGLIDVLGVRSGVVIEFAWMSMREMEVVGWVDRSIEASRFGRMA